MCKLQWIGFLFVALVGCRKSLPEGLDRELLNETIAYADATAPLCDQLLEHPCYTGPSWPDPPDPSLPRVPRPTRLSDDQRVRSFYASCRSSKDPTGKGASCKAEEVKKAPKDDENCLMQVAPGWPSPDFSNVGEYVGVTQKDKCRYPWFSLTVVRQTSAGNAFVVGVSVLSRSYLGSRPDLDRIETGH